MNNKKIKLKFMKYFQCYSLNKKKFIISSLFSYRFKTKISEMSIKILFVIKYECIKKNCVIKFILSNLFDMFILCLFNNYYEIFIAKDPILILLWLNVVKCLF